MLLIRTLKPSLNMQTDSVWAKDCLLIEFSYVLKYANYSRLTTL